MNLTSAHAPGALPLANHDSFNPCWPLPTRLTLTAIDLADDAL